MFVKPCILITWCLIRLAEQFGDISHLSPFNLYGTGGKWGDPTDGANISNLITCIPRDIGGQSYHKYSNIHNIHQVQKMFASHQYSAI